MQNRGFELISQTMKKNEGTVMLPLRGTKTSAGYDFHAPVDLIIKPQEKVFFWTDVKAYMNPGEVLLLDIRSSIGVKQDLMLSNTIPVIDSDYHNNEGNEGNIGISIRNMKPDFKLLGYINQEVVIPYDEGTESRVTTISIPQLENLTFENTVVIQAGERIAQGIFLEFKESDNCNSDTDRKGGFGSTT